MAEEFQDGITIKEFVELMEYIEENHSWKHMGINAFSEDKCDYMVIKYISPSIDTRDGLIWSISFKQMHKCNGLKDKVLTARKDISFKDDIYNFLKGVK